VKLAADVDLAELASRTPGFVGADLANVVNEAALHAAEQDKPAIEMADFDEAIDRAMAGMERKSRVMNEQEKITIAYHEAGHALIAQSRAHCDPVKKVSIIPRGVAALGYTQQVPAEDRYVLRESELLDRLDALLGGRVAEELVFGDVSTGAANDLDRASALARHMVTRCGMSEPLERIAKRLLESEVIDHDTLLQLIDGGAVSAASTTSGVREPQQTYLFDTKPKAPYNLFL
jgi:cell division protease FtsH